MLVAGEPAGAAARDSQVVLDVLEAAVRRRWDGSLRSDGRGGNRRDGGQCQGAGRGKDPHRKSSWQAAEQGDFLPNQG